MKKLIFLLLPFIFIPFTSITCKKVEPRASNTVQTEQLARLDAIPLTYGSFVTVTVNPAIPRTAELWFQDNNNTIRMVQVSLEDKAIIENVIVIPRN